MSNQKLKLLESALEKLMEAREELSLYADLQDLEAQDELFNQIFVIDEVTDIVAAAVETFDEVTV
jgi:hypothetical protein